MSERKTRYQSVDPDDIIHLKGGEKFITVKADALMPDGSFRPKKEGESVDDWVKYCQDRIREAAEDMNQTSAQLRSRLTKMMATLAAPEKFLVDRDNAISMHIQAFEQQKGIERRERYEDVIRKIELRLEPNDVSRIHRLTEGEYILPTIGTPGKFRIEAAHIFVVRHDWLAAVGDKNIAFSLWRPPFDTCLFEYRVGGHTVIVSVAEHTSIGYTYRYIIEVERDVWFDLTDIEAPLKTYLRRQVAAACVVLDAEVAVHSLVKQPQALNKKRIKSGKIPLFDYHVIDLTKKKVATVSSGPTEDLAGPCMRLHFVRGHERKLPSGDKTWVRWHLRGDGDLGFVDKHYKL